MEYTQLGSEGPVISRVAFGNSLTAGEQVADATAHACVRTALDAGITVFDTADVYAAGRAETLLGRALAGTPRDAVILCTKVGRGAPDGGAPLSRRSVLNAAEGSLRRLGTEYIDLYQAHLYDDATPLEETAAAFAELVRAGKVRYIGVSEWAADEIERFAAMGLPLVANQPQLNMVWRVAESEVVPACMRLGVGQLAWSPLAGGLLTGKYRPGAPAPAGSRPTRGAAGATSMARFRLLSDDVLERVALLDALAREAGWATAALALAWVLGRPGVAAAIVGASRPEQITANLRAVGTSPPAEVMMRAEAILAPVTVTDPDLTLSRMLRRRPAGGPEGDR